MSAAFSRSMRSLRGDDQRSSIGGILLAGALLGAWIAWLFLARIERVERSETARLEVDQAVHRVEAPASGKVAAVHLTLGAEVQAGDVLVELDDRALRLELDEKRAQLAAVAAQVEPLHAELKELDRALRETREAGRSEVGEARARVREAEAMAHFQETEADRVTRLRKDGIASKSEAARLAADAQAKRAAVDAQGLGVQRVGAEQRSRESEHRADLVRLGREETALEGEKSALAAAIGALLAAVERRRIVAPIAGRVGEISALHTGAFVHEGDLVAAIVPRGDLKVVAEFPPSSIGRIRAGQPCRVRLDAFAWTEFGVIPATVESVATEAQNGRIRVELDVHPDATSAIPMQHGLLGTAIVEVERVSPLTLVLRAAGQLTRDGQAGGG